MAGVARAFLMKMILNSSRPWRPLHRKVQAPLIVNAVGADYSATGHDWKSYVSAMVFDANGNRVGRYDKIHLVPFGEYIPFQRSA